MKKLLLFTVLLLSVICVKAQYGVHYTPFTPHNASQPITSSRTVRTTAYYEYQGDYYKLPIRAAISEASTYDMERIAVVSYYNSDPYTGGSWEEVLNATYATKCISVYTNGNDLENNFMYEAYIFSIGTVYFDL